jgi:phospholipase D1/2
MPLLHVFIVIPHPEDDGMVPRTYDMVTELGASDTMKAQGGLVDRGKVSQNYSDAKKGKNGTKVLDRPSAEELANSYGLKVSLARLRSSGLDRDHQMGYREIYIHSKLMIIDDVFLTVGSANLNQRSMSSDSEINVGVTGLKYVAPLRQRAFSILSGGGVQGSGAAPELPDVFDRWNDLMQQNVELRQAKGRMQGFLLPFEDHRATNTMHAQITIPSDGRSATA